MSGPGSCIDDMWGGIKGKLNSYTLQPLQNQIDLLRISAARNKTENEPAAARAALPHPVPPYIHYPQPMSTPARRTFHLFIRFSPTK